MKMTESGTGSQCGEVAHRTRAPETVTRSTRWLQFARRYSSYSGRPIRVQRPKPSGRRSVTSHRPPATSTMSGSKSAIDSSSVASRPDTQRSPCDGSRLRGCGRRDRTGTRGWLRPSPQPRRRSCPNAGARSRSTRRRSHPRPSPAGEAAARRVGAEPWPRPPRNPASAESAGSAGSGVVVVGTASSDAGTQCDHLRAIRLGQRDDGHRHQRRTRAPGPPRAEVERRTRPRRMGCSTQ